MPYNPAVTESELALLEESKQLISLTTEGFGIRLPEANGHDRTVADSHVEECQKEAY
jgi:hypothetical protein